MTREHKLSLILGFSVVLMVAVLISDHFSSAQQQELGLADAAEPATSEVTPLRPLDAPPPQPTGRRITGALASGAEPAPRPSTTSPTTMTPRAQREPTHLVIDQGSRRIATEPTPNNSPSGIATDTATTSIITQGVEALDDFRRRFEEQGRRYLEQAPAAVNTRRESIPRVPLAEGTRPQTASQTASQTTNDTVRPQTPPHRLYVITDGDSLYRIAQREYGDGNLWRKLAAFNADRVGDNGSVRTGVAIKIPPRAALTNTPSTTAQPATTRQTRSTKAPKPAPATRTYTVKKGDSLTRICARELGSATRIDEVLALNPRVKTADTIWVGMELTLPAD